MVNQFGYFVRSAHSAVRLNNSVIIIGGRGYKGVMLSTRKIWVYDLNTGGWRKHVIHRRSQAPDPFEKAVVAAIDGTIYTFGGYDRIDVTNDLWKLSRTKSGCFTWSFIKPRCPEESPSPRGEHTGWDFNGKLYTFGGEGYAPAMGYLNDHGESVLTIPFSKNNQLLCFDPNIQMWTNPQCFGAVPSPRSGHSSTISGEKAWLYGGQDTDVNCFDNLFELNMSSLTWNQIPTKSPRPQACILCTLTVVTESQLVLCGGSSGKKHISDTWIMDLTTHSWKRYTSANDHTRVFHTATVGLYRSVIIMGGRKCILDEYKGYHPMLYVMLEPDSLQTLALHIIHKHRDELPVKFLPKKLTALLDISEK